MKPLICSEDLLSFHFLAQPRLSPDGKSVLYRLSQARKEENDYDSSLWCCHIESGENRQITNGLRDREGRWSPDGQTIFFLSDRNGRKGETSIYQISPTGGEASVVLTVPFSVSTFEPLGDNAFLVQATWKEEQYNPEEADYLKFSRIPITSNGKGYVASQQERLFLCVDGDYQPLTSEDFSVLHWKLNAARSRVVVVGSVVIKGIKSYRSSVLLVELASKTIDVLSDGSAWHCSAADWWNQELVLSITTMKKRGINESCRLHIYHEDEMIDLMPGFDRAIGNSVNCDCRFGNASWSGSFIPDGDRLFFLCTHGGTAPLMSLRSGEAPTKFCDFVVDDFDVKVGQVVFVGLRKQQLQELYVSDGTTVRQLTYVNEDFTSAHAISVPQNVKSSVEGWVLMPPDHDGKASVPAILHIHGGPHTAFGTVYHHEMQCWAAQGYAVLFCNPRGSDGYGDEFADIRGKYGTVDYEDIMAFTDEACRQFPCIDTSRLGVTGGSYGGFMTNWIIGHTNRFKAAVTQRSICNWISFHGSSDIGYYFSTDQNSADPLSDPKKLWWHSPLRYAEAFVTPTLIIHSDQDYRCELDQGIQLFTALKLHGVDSSLCIFKEDTHELSRSGHPRSRLARMREITSWFNYYLNDQKNASQ